MPFLGAEMALPCFVGRWVGNFPSPWPWAPKTGGISGGEIPGHFGWVLRAYGGRLEDSRGQKPAHPQPDD